MSDDPLSLARTKNALDVYKRIRALLMDSAGTSDFNRLYADLEVADRQVREAFAADTTDRNPRETAMLVHPESEWLKQMVDKYGGE